MVQKFQSKIFDSYVFLFCFEGGGVKYLFLLFFNRLGLFKYPYKIACFYLAWNYHKSFRWWWVGGGWFESKFSVSFGPIRPGFQLQILTWTKLNNSSMDSKRSLFYQHLVIKSSLKAHYFYNLAHYLAHYNEH